MRKANAFNQAERGKPRFGGLILPGDPQMFTDAKTNLCNFQRVRQACAVEIAFAQAEYLGFGLQGSERSRVDNASAVALKMAVY